MPGFFSPAVYPGGNAPGLAVSQAVVYCRPILRVHCMSYLLVLDASSSLCSVALGDEKHQWHLTEHQPRRHAQRLLPMVDDILTQAGIARSELSGIAYGCGPGSFTGIRIAASVMQGIAMALNIPVAGVSSLQAIAQAVFKQTDAQQVMAVMDAHMGEVFWAIYQRQSDLCCLSGNERVGSPAECLVQMQDFSGVVAGDGLTLPDFSHVSQQWADIQPQADIMLQLARPLWLNGAFGTAEEHPPVYLRDSVAWKKLDEQPSLLKRH